MTVKNTTSAIPAAMKAGQSTQITCFMSFPRKKAFTSRQFFESPVANRFPYVGGILAPRQRIGDAKEMLWAAKVAFQERAVEKSGRSDILVCYAVQLDVFKLACQQHLRVPR